MYYIGRLAVPAAMLAAMSFSSMESNAAEYMTPVEESPVICAAGSAIGEVTGVEPEYMFIPVHEAMYLVEDAVLKGAPYDDAVDVKTLSKYSEITVVGWNNLKYQQVDVDGSIWYVDCSSMTDDKSVVDAMRAEEQRLAEEAAAKAEQERLEAEAAALAAQMAVSVPVQQEVSYQAYAGPVQAAGWDGSVLTPSAGVNYGPSGKETYYNLDMSVVVGNVQSMGYSGEYWVREDGAKMLGDYVIVAANLDTHPRGSLVETSLGTGIVADTGTFAYGNPNQVDIATAWQ